MRRRWYDVVIIDPDSGMIVVCVQGVTLLDARETADNNWYNVKSVVLSDDQRCDPISDEGI